MAPKNVWGEKNKTTMMKQQCQGISKITKKQCSRHQKAKYCHQHTPNPNFPVAPSTKPAQSCPRPPVLVTIPFDFGDAPHASKLKAFHAALKKISWKEYTIEWRSGDKVVLVKPIHGLTACKHPQKNVFNSRDMDHQSEHAYSMLSKTKSSRLVIPFRPYSHLQCFVHEAPFEQFASVFRLTQEMVRKARRPVRVFTEGLEVGWLHVKIR